MSTRAAPAPYTDRHHAGGFSAALAAQLSAEVAKIPAVPVIREKLVNSGMEPHQTGPHTMAALMKSDCTDSVTIIKAVDIKIET